MLIYYKLFLAIFILIIPGLGEANATDFIDKDVEINTEKEIIYKRIVTLTSLTADIVSKLNNSYLIGIPGSRLTKTNNNLINKEIVSQGRTPPQLEKIISLKPDLVIGSKSFHKKQLKKLSSVGIKSLGVEVRNWLELNNLIDNLSSLTGVDGSPVKKYLKNCNLKGDKKSNNKVLILASAKPLLAPNSKSWAGDLLNRFDLNNSSKMLESKSQFKGYVNLSPEWLISNQPEKIIVVNTGSGSKKSFINLPYWSNLKAVKKNNVIYMDYYGLVNPGSIDSINKTCLTLSKINS